MILDKVSIIVPVYNAERYISAALASMLLQTHSNFEIIAINDGSVDRSSEILRSAAARDRRIHLIERENRGLIATLNEGLQHASADFVARMDADDIAYPERLAVQLRAFAADPELALSGCNFDTMFSDSRMLRLGVPNATDTVELRVMSRFFTILRHSTVMFRRSRIPEGMLRYDETYPCAEDFDLFRRIAEQCRVAQTSEPLLAYRLHDTSVSATKAATMAQSHVTLVEEGLQRHYPEAAGTGFGRITQDASSDAVARAADLIRKLDRLADRQPVAEQRAFRLGVRQLFYFIYANLCAARKFEPARDFIEQSGHWDMIRRRERPILRAARHAPALSSLGFAALEANALMVRALRARKVRDVIPAHRSIGALARACDFALPPQDVAGRHA